MRRNSKMKEKIRREKRGRRWGKGGREDGEKEERRWRGGKGEGGGRD